MPTTRKRGKYWYCEYYDTQGQRHEVSTKCTTKRAADVVARRKELEAQDPNYAAANATTVEECLNSFIEHYEELAAAGRRADATVTFHTRKAGHLLRVLGRGFPLSFLKAKDVDAYISTRRGEGAVDNTISKELVTLRGALKLAKRRGDFMGDLDAVLPVAFSPRYKPKTRWLTQAEVLKLLGTLTEDHAARVAFIVATSAELGATDRARDEDIERDRVLVRGTKRESRWRTVPIVATGQRELLDWVEQWCQGEDGLLFKPWRNIRRDLAAACKRASEICESCDHRHDEPKDVCESCGASVLFVETCTPNDLRRTFSHWMKQEGIPNELIAPAMGHRDTRMVERVYGRLSTEELGYRMAAEMENDCRKYAADNADSSDSSDSETVVSTWKASPMVPRDGIEPPTRGFSIFVGNRPRVRKDTVTRKTCRDFAADVPQRRAAGAELAQVIDIRRSRL